MMSREEVAELKHVAYQIASILSKKCRINIHCICDYYGILDIQS
jgi:hypothetical protein